MSSKEWLTKYESKKESLRCKIDLDAYFTENKIGKINLDVLNLGKVSFPTGKIIACDPLIELEDAPAYIQNIPPGNYNVDISVALSEKFGDRYSCVKVLINDNKPAYYDLGVIGNEDLDEELEDDEYFGFCVDAGMGCILDESTQAAFKEYWKVRCEKEEGIDPYNDLFCDLFVAYAEKVLEGLGGKENIASVDNCITRIRCEVVDGSKVNDEILKSSGAKGVLHPSDTAVQVIVGTQVQFVVDELKKMLK